MDLDSINEEWIVGLAGGEIDKDELYTAWHTFGR